MSSGMVIDEVNRAGGLLGRKVEAVVEGPGLHGATLNQPATPAIDYLMSPVGGSRKKFYLPGLGLGLPADACLGLPPLALRKP